MIIYVAERYVKATFRAIKFKKKIIDRDRVAIHPTPSSLLSRKSSCLNAKECNVVTSVDVLLNPFTRKYIIQILSYDLFNITF